MANDTTLVIKNRSDKDRTIKDAIFAFSGGTKSLMIKGEGNEISTAVEVAEILKHRMYPSIEIANISLGSRPYYNHKRRGYKNRQKPKQKKDLISNIEITLSKLNL
ncbi:MAG: ribonuclease P subunit p25 family protein [Promethearchaeota archaeon]